MTRGDLGTKRYADAVVAPDAMPAVKVIKVMGTSEESWEDAAKEALQRASQSVDDISGVEVKKWTASIEDDEVVRYKATTEIAFPVHDE